MGFVQFSFVAVVLLTAQSVLSAPEDLELTGYDGCKLCPAGMFQKSCTECEACLPGTYTAKQNQEESCHLCFRDCLPRNHLIVTRNCTNTSNLKCECEPGYECSEKAPQSDNCRRCERKAAATPSKPRGIYSATTSRAILNQSSNSYIRGVRAVSTASTKIINLPDQTNTQLGLILSSFIFLGVVALFILFCIYHARDGRCFRQTIAKLCNEKRHDTSQAPRDSFRARQHPPSTANLGSVHVHNPGTVIFSWLSQFTDQVGPTVHSGKRAERASTEEAAERYCPVFHPASPSDIHFSEEEKSGETGNIFFPSQEQGKDFQMSKEEMV